MERLFKQVKKNLTNESRKTDNALRHEYAFCWPAREDVLAPQLPNLEFPTTASPVEKKYGAYELWPMD